MKTGHLQEEWRPANHLIFSHLFYTSFKSSFLEMISNLTNRGNLCIQWGVYKGTITCIVPSRDSDPPNLLALWHWLSLGSGGRPRGRVSKPGAIVCLCLENCGSTSPKRPRNGTDFSEPIMTTCQSLRMVKGGNKELHSKERVMGWVWPYYIMYKYKNVVLELCIINTYYQKHKIKNFSII